MIYLLVFSKPGQIKFGALYLEGIEVKDGKTTEHLVGIISIPNMQPDFVEGLGRIQKIRW